MADSRPDERIKYLLRRNILDFLKTDGIPTINSDFRRLWYGIFNPSTDISDRITKAEGARLIFERLSQMSFIELERVCLSNYWKNTDMPKEKHLKVGGAFASIASGRYFVVPIMVSGIMPGAFVNSYLSEKGRSDGFALVGYSTGAYKDYFFNDGSKIAGMVNISEFDLEILRGNKDKNALMVDDTLVTGGTATAVINKLKDIGFRNISKLIWTPSTPIVEKQVA